MAEKDIELEVGLNIADSEIKKVAAKVSAISETLNNKLFSFTENTPGVYRALQGIENYGAALEYAHNVSRRGKTDALTSIADKAISLRGLGRMSSALINASTHAGPEQDKNIESALQVVEKKRFITQLHLNEERNLIRNRVRKDYWETAVDKALKYNIAESNPEDAKAILDYFGLKYKGDTRIKTVDPKAYSRVNEWSDILTQIKEKEESLESGSFKERRKTLKDLTVLADKLVKTSKGLGSDIEQNSKTIAQNTKETVKKTSGRLDFRNIAKTIGVAGIKSFADFGEFALESMWGEHVTRNVYDSRRAQASRMTEFGKAAGGVIGGVIGGILGSIIPGVGSVAGVAVGSYVSEKLGGLYGKHEQTMLESDIKSAGQMAQRLRAKAVYGQAYNTFFSQAITDSGIANGESAMGSLADKAMGMRGRMMLGQVGEQEMLYMSMMPNYYMALMNGVTGPELSRIYAQDLQNITDPSLRYVVGNAMGGGEAYAMANNPSFMRNYDKLTRSAMRAEGMVASLETGYYMTQSDVAKQNARKVSKEILESAMRGDKDVFSKKYDSLGNSAAYKVLEKGDRFFNPEDRVGGGTTKGSTFVTVVQIDGEEIKRAVNTVDDMQKTTNDLQTFYVGGL